MYMTTLCFLVQGEPIHQIILGKKKTGFGVGKYNGFGGKVEPGESVEQAAVREVYEEAGVRILEKDLTFVGELAFIFPNQPEVDHNVRIFLVKTWEGVPQETEEMAPFGFDINSIPYQEMWQDDIFWLPKVINGEKVCAKVIFEDDGEGIKEYIRQPG